MSLVFKTPKSTLNTTSKAIQNLGGDCPPCPEPVLESKELEYTQNGEYTVTPEEGVDGFSSIDINVNLPLNKAELQCTQNGDYVWTARNNDCEGFYEVDLTVNVPSDVNNQNKTVSPLTISQTVEADNGYTGLGTVTVNPVTSSIDNNISAGNIKKDVTILGVTGNYDPQPNLSNLNITPSTNAQEYNPAISGVDGYNLVSVAAVTAAIDSNIQSANILSGVTILGVAGSDEGYAAGYSAGETDGEAVGYAAGEAAGEIAGAAAQKALLTSTTITQNGTTTREDGWNSVTVNVQPNLQSKTITPTTAIAGYTPDQGYDGFGYVQVNGVTSAIDQNITAKNIKDGVTILGVTGSYDPRPAAYSQTFNANVVGEQTFYPDGIQGDYYDEVTVNTDADPLGSAYNSFEGGDVLDDYVNAGLNKQAVYAYFYIDEVTSGAIDPRTGYYVAEDTFGSVVNILPYLPNPDFDPDDPDPDPNIPESIFPDGFDLVGKWIKVGFSTGNATITEDDDPNADYPYTIEISESSLQNVNGSDDPDDWFNEFNDESQEWLIGRHTPQEMDQGTYFSSVYVSPEPMGSFFSPITMDHYDLGRLSEMDWDWCYLSMEVDSGDIDPSTGYYDAEDQFGNIFHIRPYEDNPDFDDNLPEDPQTNPRYIFPVDFGLVGYEIQVSVSKSNCTFDDPKDNGHWIVEVSDCSIEGINWNGDRDTWAIAYWGAL